MFNRLYTDGLYLDKNPTWHVEDSPWKAEQIMRIINRNGIRPRTVCEIGCGAGEILRQLQHKIGADCDFWGYEISPQAFALCTERGNGKLHFRNKDILDDSDLHFDVLLLIDLIEHLEDYLGFLRSVRHMSTYKVFHIPLDLSVQTVLLARPLMESRESVGHIHYFTKELALQMLRDAAYEVLDHFFTPSYMARAARAKSTTKRTQIADALRRLFFPLREDLTVRILGEYSLMVLAK
jgi:SAM-dependent methyltransferase